MKVCGAPLGDWGNGGYVDGLLQVWWVGFGSLRSWSYSNVWVRNLGTKLCSIVPGKWNVSRFAFQEFNIRFMFFVLSTQWRSSPYFSFSLYLSLAWRAGKEALSLGLCWIWHINCLVIYQIQHSPKLNASFPALHAKDKHNYNTRSAAHNPLDIPLTKTSTYGKNSIKNHCIRNWNNLKKDLLDIPDSELSLSKIKSPLKQKYFGQYWTLSWLSSKCHTPQSVPAIIPCK